MITRFMNEQSTLKKEKYPQTTNFFSWDNWSCSMLGVLLVPTFISAGNLNEATEKDSLQRQKN